MLDMHMQAHACMPILQPGVRESVAFLIYQRALTPRTFLCNVSSWFLTRFPFDSISIRLFHVHHREQQAVSTFLVPLAR
jgi:hypothetical protein